MNRDEHYMRRALALAVRGRGFVEPNPMVGAVIVRDGTIVGEGYHERFGGEHAEARALAQAGSSTRRATLYVTLEPCCHFGKTPPCADAVVAAGISRVVAAMADPFEGVAGQGLARLQAAGISVEVGELEQEARALNAPFLKLITRRTPYVHAKWAMTLDGKIATPTGESKWISGEASRQVAHQLRARMDAILVGVDTVLADDPLLTARPPGPRSAVRIVLDSRGRLPVKSRLVLTARDTPVLVATTDQMPAEHADLLRHAGCECLILPRDGESRVCIQSLLHELGMRKLTNLLIEGGSRVLGSFHDLGEIDELHVFVAGKTLGGQGMTPVSGAGISRIVNAREFVIAEVSQIGADCLIRCISIDFRANS